MWIRFLPVLIQRSPRCPVDLCLWQKASDLREHHCGWIKGNYCKSDRLVKEWRSRYTVLLLLFFLSFFSFFLFFLSLRSFFYAFLFISIVSRFMFLRLRLLYFFFISVFLFYTVISFFRPDLPWGPPSLLYNRYRVSFPGVKRSGRGVDHPPWSSARIKERIEL
jgi:hypothetical protein